MKNPKNSTWLTNPEKILLFDNGSFEIKHSSAKSTRIRKFQNCKFSDKSLSETAYYIDDIHDDLNTDLISTIGKNFQRPLSRGLLYDIDLQCDIWEKLLEKNYKKSNLEMSYDEYMMIFTHTPLAPDNVMEGYFQIIFEYFGFDACLGSIPHIFTAMSAKQQYPDINPLVQLVIDSGFSSTTIVPVFDNRPIYNAMKRIDISGKLLTNYLKESLSTVIDLDLRKEFFLVNLMKEETCFVSKNFNIDMKISALKGSENNINRRLFILPEYRKKSTEILNKTAKEKYAIELNSLRFIVPELLFNPNLIGIEEGGLQDGIAQAIKECHGDYKNLLFENIIVSGGNGKFQNFKERLQNELIPVSDVNTDIRIYEMGKSESVIQGMRLFADDMDVLMDLAIFKSDYEEIGFNAVWKNCL
jgi:actin-related protein 6